jgi:hypothetical protein
MKPQLVCMRYIFLNDYIFVKVTKKWITKKLEREIIDVVRSSYM